MYDYMIEDALIYDGSGAEPFKGNVATFGGNIAFIGKERVRCRSVIKGSGLVLTPGFVDFHAHSEFLALRTPLMKEKLMQGITTDLSGNCGIGPFPVGDEPEMLYGLASDVLGPSPRWSWKDFSSFSSILEKQGTGINMAFLQAHAPLRVAAMGDDCSRAASDEEIAKMCELLSASLEQGCFGLSSGLYYAPCVFAERKELLALLKTAASHDAFFAVHHRCEGNDIVESVKEVLDLALESGVRLEISHLKAIGRKNQEKVDIILSMIEEYRERGVNVLFDQYPYLYGSTSLFSLLPPDALSLSRNELRFALALESERERYKEEMLHPEHWDSIYEMVGPDDIRILSMEGKSEYEGLSLTELGEKLSTDPLSALFDVLSDETGSAVMMDVTQSEESLVKIMRSPLMCFGTDALYSGEHLHPRSYSGALELLSVYGLQKKVMPLEELVRKMTSEGARRLGLSSRGLVKESLAADLVMFNPRFLKATATADGAFTRNEGLSMVMVNGNIVVEHGAANGLIKGEIIKRK